MVQDRYTGTYNGRPIVFRIWSIERRHIQWPWTTLRLPLFQCLQRHAIMKLMLHISTTVQDTQFQWNRNRHLQLQMPYLSVISNDLEW